MIWSVLGDSLLRVMLGSMTGALAFPVVMGWFFRHLGKPEAQGRRVLVYLIASSVLLGGMAVWLIVGPWL